MTIEKKDTNVVFAFYGSLRKGDYNFERFSEGLEVIDTGLHLKGFKMFSLGPYPFIIKTGKDEDIVIVDITESNWDTAQRIAAMEYGAGYKEHIAKIGQYFARVFYYEMEEFSAKSRFEEVPNGDWLKYKYPEEILS